MYKKLFFILFTFINAVNSMDEKILLTNISKNEDLMGKLTEQLCAIDKYSKNTSMFIRDLSHVNKFFRNYYTREDIQQKIINIFEHRFSFTKKANTLNTAKCLGCHKIAKKISDLHQKVRDENQILTKKDLAESNSWYLQSTTTSWYLEGLSNPLISEYNESNDGDIYCCLLTVAIFTSDVKKTGQLIDSPGFSTRNRPLKIIAYERRKKKCYGEELFDICRLVLTKISPDHRHFVNEYTPLMCAAEGGDKQLARLLLGYGANPFLLCCTSSDKNYSCYDTYDHTKQTSNHEKIMNAFTLEQGDSKGWLMDMYNEIKKDT